MSPEMDFTFRTDFDGTFFYIQVANVKIAFLREDIDSLIEHMKALRDEINSYGCAS